MAEAEDEGKKAEAEVTIKAVSLKRNLGLPSGVALIIGTMIGEWPVCLYSYPTSSYSVLPSYTFH